MHDVTRTRHRYVRVDDVRVFYRETEPTAPDPPTLLLLHGFPAGSHQFRRLMDTLGSSHRLIAPDYPGFGFTEAPPDYDYSFEQLATTMEGFVEHLGLDRFSLYLFDFGAPVGFRLAERLSSRVSALVVQNGNIYAEGLSTQAQEYVSLHAEGEGHEDRVREMLTLEQTRWQYEHGSSDLELIPPESWWLDHTFLELPGRRQAQVALAFDYGSNVQRYTEWQAWLAHHRPPVLVLWGTKDPFFLPAGARAYLTDVPDARVHLLDTGHFALEDQLPRIAPLIADFLAST